MVDFNCRCGNLVAEGKIEWIDIKGTKKSKLLLDMKTKGTIIRNNSNLPTKWTFVCSECQSKENNNERK
jgi:hypothetical protein